MRAARVRAQPNSRRHVSVSGACAVSLRTRRRTIRLPDTRLRSWPLPGGLTFTDNGNGTATITGTPTADAGTRVGRNVAANSVLEAQVGVPRATLGEYLGALRATAGRDPH